MDNQATQTMLQAVEAAKASARKAESTYSAGVSKINRLASQQIRLGVGTAVSQVSDIASTVRRVNDDYFAAFQTLVAMLDSQCRPLLAYNPEVFAIREVRDTIKWLNDESEIKTTFSASVNDSSRGDVAAVSYVPTMENKMIQKFWETVYDTHPGKDKFEQAERQKAQMQKESIENRVKAENDAYKKSYETALAAWSEKRAEIQKKREAEVKRELEQLKKDRKQDIEKRYAQSLKNGQNHKTFCENKKKGHERALAKLGFFNFAKKREAKEGIKISICGIAEAERMIETAERVYQKETAELDAWIRAQKAVLEEKVRKKYPMPKKPRKQTAYTVPQKIVDEST